MVIPRGLSLWGVLFYGGVSCTYPLHSCRDKSGFEIYLFEHESKNSLREKRRMRRIGSSTGEQETIFFSETPRFQPGAGHGSGLWGLWLVVNDIIPRASPPPIPTMSSEPKHLSDVMQGGPVQAAPLPPFFHFIFPPLVALTISPFPKKKSLLHLFISPQTQGAEICS